MKGIVLAGGLGSRLSPITKIISKQMLLIYDKPLIFYPISTLMLAGIRDIQIICTSRDLLNFKTLLGDGSQLGVNFFYSIQDVAAGLPDGIIKSEDFIKNDRFALILGDNFFFGAGLGTNLRNLDLSSGAHILTFQVSEPSKFGIIEIDSSGLITNMVEKPKTPRSNLAITGLYFFESDAIEKSKSLKVSGRNELEIVDLLKIYWNEGRLRRTDMPRGTIWLDTGSFDAILEASHYVKIIQTRQNLMIANLEEIAWRNGWLTDSQLRNFAINAKDSQIKEYLLNILMNSV